MPNSLKCKLSSLRYKRLLTDEEYQELIKKLDGHDREVRNKAIDDFTERLKKDYVNFDMYYILQNNNYAFEKTSLKTYQDMIDEIAQQLKGEKQ